LLEFGQPRLAAVMDRSRSNSASPGADAAFAEVRRAPDRPPFQQGRQIVHAIAAVAQLPQQG
jgi:hypothetical protein